MIDAKRSLIVLAFLATCSFSFDRAAAAPVVVETTAGVIVSGEGTKASAAPGQSLVVTASYASDRTVAKASAGVQIFDSSGRGIFRVFEPTSLTAGQPTTKAFAFTLPADLKTGTYRVVTAAFVSSTWVLVAANDDVRFEVAVPVIPPPKLVWADEFDALDLASAENPLGTWRPNNRWQNISAGGFKDFAGTSWNVNPNHPQFSRYTPFSVKDGILTVRAFRTPSDLVPAIKTQMGQQGIGGAVPQWSGGYLVQNYRRQTHRYGYFEYRARWPNSGKGMFPALWLLGSEGGTDPSNKGAAEIDVVEMFGQPGLVKTTLHLKDNAKVGPSVAVGSYRIDVSRWHTYGVDWQPGALKFYVDGRLAYEANGSDAAYYTTTMNVRLNYAMDANWFPASLKSDASTPDELTMNVDYVRVYDRYPY